MIKHHKALIKAKRYSGSLLRLNVGCGENKKDGYINVDICNKECLQLDMREKLPFSDKSVSIIYSEHFLEHLPEQYALQFLNESFRVLIPGGLFSAGVPDGQVLLESYANGLNVENFKIHELSDILPGKPTTITWPIQRLPLTAALHLCLVRDRIFLSMIQRRMCLTMTGCR